MLFDRVAQPSTQTRTVSQTKIFFAPSNGLIRNDNLAKPKALGAEVMDNWFPTVEGCRMRGGSDKHATIAAAVTFMTPYEAGAASKLFATSASAIYDVTTPADPDVSPVAAVAGQTSGDWSAIQFTNSGGSFLMMVNGHDSLERFDGTTWLAVTGVSAGAITGVATTGLSHIWTFKERIFFIQGATMSAWYLAVNAIAGAATELPLGSLFDHGGSLLFGATMSTDAGDGLDDYCLFVTTEGEAAVYQGSDPGDPADWSLVGVYKIGRPLHKNAHFKAGGDRGIMTNDGIISMTAAMAKDRAGLRSLAITAPVEPLWRDAIAERYTGVFPFTCVMWPEKAMLVAGVPASAGQAKYNFAFNTTTGGAARFTGWDIRCLVIYNDNLYFGTSAGTIVQGDVTGADQGVPYSAVVIPKFETFGRPEEKVAILCRMIARANHDFSPQLFSCSDYDVQIPTVLSADPDSGANVWGTGLWGTMTWGEVGEAKARQSVQQEVAAIGQALAPGLQITTGRATAPDVELITLHLTYEVGEI